MNKTFQQFVKEDSVRRYVEYKAHEWGVLYSEAARRSLGRVYDHITKNTDVPIAILTAFRGEKSLAANRSTNKALEADFRRLGWGFIPVVGGFVEKVRDAEGKETGETKKIDGEESYFVTGDSINGFRVRVLNLIHKYAQEAAVVKYPGNPDAYLLSDAGGETSLGKWSNNKMAEYFTRMRKGPAGRQFNFEAAGDSSRTTMMAVDKFFESKE
jgi:hypothetical protein